MSKILSSWSGMRKYLEQEMLSESLKGRVRYGATSYVGMDGCRIFELVIDNEQIKRFSWETVNTYFIDNGFKDNPDGKYWDEYWQLLDKIPLTGRTEYTDGEFCDALKAYRNQDIKESIISENPLVVMFALLDRRVGKRTLIDIKDRTLSYPLWIQKIYKIRASAENL